MNKDAKIYVTGHSGLVGLALISMLKERGFTNILTARHAELDLLDQHAVDKFFEENKPEYVFHLAAKVGGIVGNKTLPGDFTYENIQINTNVIHSAHKHGAKKLLNFGSVCIYPKLAEVPVREDSFLTGPLEYTNEGYAIAKIAGLMMCKKYKEQFGDNFISVMPANLYGPNDNYHPEHSHVIPALMKRIHDAKLNNTPEVVIWGTGNPTRDFLYSFDLADGLIFLMEKYDGLEHINIGPSKETSIRELAETMCKVIGYEGKLTFDTSKPDGTPRRYLDVSRINELGWSSKVSLEEGLKETYQWFTENINNLRM